MIHFFPIYSKDAAQSPFAQALDASGVAYRMFCDQLRLRYRYRIQLLLLGMPKLLWFAIASALRSLVLAQPRPSIVVLGSHLEVLVFAWVKWLWGRSGTRIVLLGFIYTDRDSRLLRTLRLRYFRFVLSLTDRVLCHSTLEVTRYSQLFPGTTFRYVPYGLHIAGRESLVGLPSAAVGAKPFILSAGRSGRDYGTLFAAVQGLPVDLHVICDNEAMVAGLPVSENITILRRCYDDCYIQQIREALAVVIPLGVGDISAGQMVLIQAMAYAKPTAITRTDTSVDYVTDEVESLLVPQGDVAALRACIERLISDADLRQRLSAHALNAYEARYSMAAHVRHILQAMDVV